jgi:DNA-binding MarR family transcriptional regulator
MSDMQSMEEKLRVLEQTSLPRILVYLLKGSASQTDLNNNISASQAATYRALSILEKNGLIAISLPEGFSRRKDISLTEKGKRLAQALEKLEALL